MAIDFGDARTGVAVSDISARIAGDAWVITEKRKHILAASILNEAIARNVCKIVVGFPKNMDGSVGFRAEATNAFVDVLRKCIDSEIGKRLNPCDIDVILWDERLTTKMAATVLSNSGKRGKKRKNTVDAVAASLILESYLDSTSHTPCT